MDQIVRELDNAIDNLLNTNLEQVDWDYKPMPEKWSKKEIVGHLIDSAQINLQRFVRCTYQENFKLTYDQVEWVQAQRYQDADIQDLVGLWELLNVQIIRVLQNYPADRLSATCDTGKTTV